MFIIATDVIGGLFAININRFDSDKNIIWYFAPDTLEWECLDIDYGQFIVWSTQDETAGFYESMRWTNWYNDVKEIPANKAVLIYPFLWSKECNIETASKKNVDLDEVINLNLDFAAGMNLK